MTARIIIDTINLYPEGYEYYIFNDKSQVTDQIKKYIITSSLSMDFISNYRYKLYIKKISDIYQTPDYLEKYNAFNNMIVSTKNKEYILDKLDVLLNTGILNILISRDRNPYLYIRPSRSTICNVDDKQLSFLKKIITNIAKPIDLSYDVCLFEKIIPSLFNNAHKIYDCEKYYKEWSLKERR